jgi:hypothetical protein
MSSASATAAPPPQTKLRPPSSVMKLERLGAFFPTRLSFLRSLLRDLAAQRACPTRTRWEIDEHGYGCAVYTIRLDGRDYSLIAFSHALDDSQRTDRVIAEAWDATFNLFDGIPDDSDLQRLAQHTPRQEAGRFLPSELVLSRANKSVRLFSHVVERLASGQQPDEQMILETGYLMRTTAVYGNGKFGIADRARLLDRAILDGPFRVELLTVWMIRGFTHDLVEHVAQARNPDNFVPLSTRFKRYLGVGNSTGLGMAPFLVSHPILINQWMTARETALARVHAIDHSDIATIEKTLALMARTQLHLQQWNVEDTRQQARIQTLKTEFQSICDTVDRHWLEQPQPWRRLIAQAQECSLECQELLVALVLEPHGHLIDELTAQMSSDRESVLCSAQSTTDLLQTIENDFQWAITIDFDDLKQTGQFWYVSEEKLEPRLGDRHTEAGAELELPLDIARRVQALHRDLRARQTPVTVAEFLLGHPQHRLAVQRVQTLQQYPYGEIRDNLIANTCLPIDMLRCKLSFFGASKFDPKSERWTRITLCQGAPLATNLQDANADDWWLPVLESTA